MTGCKTTSEISLADARKISAVGEGGIAPPPRAGVMDLINPKYLEAFRQEFCNDSPPEQLDIKKQIKLIKYGCGGYGSGYEFCLSDRLFMKGRKALNNGQYVDAITLLKTALAEDKRKGDERYRPYLATSYAAIGDFSAAWLSMGGGNSQFYRTYSGRYQVEVNYQVGQATLNRIHGKYSKAEHHYRKAIKLCDKRRELTGHKVFYDTESQFLPDFGEALMMQGRPVEAELVLRRSLKRIGYDIAGINARLRGMVNLGRVYYQQGRYEDAATMIKAAVGGYRFYRDKCSLIDLNIAYQNLARVLIAQEQPAAALEQFEQIRQNLRHTPRIFEVRFADDPDWAYALLANHQYPEAETKLAKSLKAIEGQYGSNHHQTAEVRGLLAVAQFRLSKFDQAGRNFKQALPILQAYQRESAGQANTRVAFNRRLARIAEAYMAFIYATQGGGEQAAATTFPLADTIRGQAVQQAVIASSLRVAAQDNRLAGMVRRVQDADKKITALNAEFLNAKSQAGGGGKRAENLDAEIRQLKEARGVLLDEIEKSFPAYAELTRPRPKKLAEIKAVLKPDETLLAFYIGHENTFVWSVAGKGPSGFAMLKLSSADISQRVKSIRKSLTPNGRQLSDLPRFDLTAAQQLYQNLLVPVHSAWKDAKNLIIVPHGPLGHLPFGLLVTANKIPKSTQQVPLMGYRNVPWLIRDHSINVLPSSGTLLTMRQLPESDPNRRSFAGFGDPVFNQRQAAVLAANQANTGKIATRAIRITQDASLDEGQLTTATLEMLQPLPDTREEVLSIARALNADMVQDVFLGQSASEMAVKKTDLSDRRVLVFATHGLVPGDLDGLRQPALALSSPFVTGDSDNDGVLTMGEIMGLRLNADWVVLSACNTAAGQGAGSEAVSGLGQAFFYAGTRALLVSNWPVESASARMLTTELFKQQEADPALSRSVALQKSMLKLLDTGVYRDPKTNQALYAYAHPMFWAPFSLVGEGGGR